MWPLWRTLGPQCLSVRGSERILFDQGTPVPLRLLLSGHIVATAYELGWSTVTDGDLIRLAEEEGFELLITTDTNLRIQ